MRAHKPISVDQRRFICERALEAARLLGELFDAAEQPDADAIDLYDRLSPITHNLNQASTAIFTAKYR